MMHIYQIVVGFHHFNVFDAQVHSQDWVNYLSSTMLIRCYCKLWWYYSSFISGWASRSRKEWCEEWSLVRSHSSHHYNDDDDLLTRRVWTILMRTTLNTVPHTISIYLSPSLYTKHMNEELLSSQPTILRPSILLVSVVFMMYRWWTFLSLCLSLSHPLF